VTVDPIEIEKVAEEFNLNNDYTYEKDVKIKGKSGLVHKFDLVVTSKKDDSIKIAVLRGMSDDLADDIMKFNAVATDCGIQLKALVVDKDLGEVETNLAQMYNIITIDKRSQQKSNKPELFGIRQLDDSVATAMKKGNVYMIAGKTGVGKTTTCLHFLVTGARKGEKGAIILTDTRPTEFISNSSSFTFGFDSFYKSKMIEVLELSDQIREMKYEVLSNKKEEKKFITKITTEIRKFVSANNITRLVIDPITPMLIGEDDFINMMMYSLAIPNVYTIITSNVRSSDLSFFGIEENYTSGIIKLEFADQTNGTRTMTVIKMRGGTYHTTPFRYRITSDGVVPAEEVSLPPTGGSLLKPFREAL